MDLVGEKKSKLFAADGAFYFEIPGMKGNVRFIGFPIPLSFACTVRNSQASTLNAVSVGRMRKKGSHPEFLYLAISRARSLDTLFLFENISNEEIACSSSGPSRELDDELDRLRKLKYSTINILCKASPQDSKLHYAKT